MVHKDGGLVTKRDHDLKRRTTDGEPMMKRDGLAEGGSPGATVARRDHALKLRTTDGDL